MPRYNPLANGKRRVRATSSSGLFRTTDADNCIVTQLVGNDAAEANDARQQGGVPVLLVVTMISRWRRRYAV